MSITRDIKEGSLYATLGLIVVMLLAYGGYLIAIGGLGFDRALRTGIEENRRATVEESKAYRDGMIRDLDNLRLQWIQAEPMHQSSLADIARSRAAEFPVEDLPPRLREWINELNEGRS